MWLRNKILPKGTSVFTLKFFEDSLLVITIASMLLVSALQILFRLFGTITIIWWDVLLRYLVLWICMVGAMVATRKENHININIVGSFVREKYKLFFKTLTNTFATIVSSFLAYAALVFIKDEFEAKSIAFSVIPSWVAEIIIPIALCIITLRYLVYSIESFSAFIHNPKKEHK